jgi:ABC-type dipeptide/oligopeptide/nickel transport system permease component
MGKVVAAQVMNPFAPRFVILLDGLGGWSELGCSAASASLVQVDGQKGRPLFRFVGRRAIVIVFFVHLGMSLVSNSQAARPEYNLVERGIRAWQDTRAFVFGHASLSNVDALKGAYVNSMGLILVALTIAAILGLWIGAMAALTKRRKLVLPLLTLTILGISTPSFFAALLLQVGELKYLDIFGRRLVSMGGFGWDFQHMMMPVLVLAAMPLAYLTRAAFLSLTLVMEQDFIRTAFSKGLTLRQTVNTHALRNVAIPVLTAFGVSIRFALSTLPVVEFFFSWPGMGRRLLEAIDARQTAVVAVLATAMGLTFLVVNLLLDVAYRVIDPRTREA